MNLHVGDPLEPERKKYHTIWAEPAYHEMSPGLEFVDLFAEVCKPKSGDTLVDVGCGSGLAGWEFAERGLIVTYVDLVDVVMPGRVVPPHKFIKSPIFGDWPLANKYGWDFAYCTDVLEHIPMEWTMLSAERVIRACGTAFFTIAHEPDSCGVLIGETLHLTVQPFAWWRDRLALLGNLVEARDLCARGLFIVKR